MKKQLFAALLAACAFGAAQAVSVNWDTGLTTVSSGDGHQVRVNVPYGTNGNTYGTYIITGTLTSTTNYSWVAEAFQSNGTPSTNYIQIGISGGNWTIGRKGEQMGWGSSTVSTETVAAATGDFVIGFTMAPSDNGATTVTVTVNGTTIGTLTGTLSSGGITQLKAANSHVSVEHIGTLVGASADYALDGAAIVAEAQSVPEPTALALLALGVAGLALRRREA